MDWLDGWAVAMGDTACRYLSNNNHDTIYQSLCDDGYSSAGWKLAAGVIMFLGISALMWRLLRRN